VVKTYDFLVGTVVFLSIKLVIKPPAVSIPIDRGVTSTSTTSSSYLDDWFVKIAD